MQFELIKERQYYLGKSCKLIIAECITQKDPIRKYADSFVQMLYGLREKYSNFHIEYKEIGNIDTLKQFVNENIDADILLVSAHGSYDRRNNVAGLVIGNDVWMADGEGYIIPPIVLLSACHVSPRGNGAVTVSDLLRRQGAMAVLGTFIPVDVRKNAILLLRFLIYILEAQNGSKQFETLDEAWRFVVYSNTICEIMTASTKLSDWMMEDNGGGISRFEDFTLKRSKGKLFSYDIYESTINIIKEMLKEDGKEGKFHNILDDYDFFPESIFYQFIGYPENVFLYKEAFEKMSKDSSWK